MISVLFCKIIILKIKEILCFLCFIKKINVMKMLNKILMTNNVKSSISVITVRYKY